MEKKVHDGRSMRAERNRRLIAETFLDLMEKGESSPTAQMLSDHSGVSTSTIFRLYEDLEVLYDVAMHIQFERVGSMFAEISLDQSLVSRIRELVDTRSDFYEKIATIRRFAVIRRSRSKRIDEGLGSIEKYYYSQNQKLFASELAALDSGEGFLEVVDNLTSWEAWDRMRVTQKMSAKCARDALKAALLRLLSH